MAGADSSAAPASGPGARPGRGDAVVVTGIGALTPIGSDAPGLWSGILAAANGTRPLPQPWASDLQVRFAASLSDEAEAKLADEVKPHQRRRLDRVQQMALVAAREAWADAGTPEIDPERLGVCVTSGIGGIVTLLDQYDVLKERGPTRVSPHTVPMLMPNGPAAVVALEVTARAGVHVPVSACASGAEAIAMGLDMIRAGRADVVVAGGSEAVLHPLPISGFATMRALSTRNDEPERASRPYDKGRDGFVMAEGAAIIVLERESSAVARGATIYGELAGSGMSSDAAHMTEPDPTGENPARAMKMALADAGEDPTAVGYINAHATSTPLGDASETRVIKNALGEEHALRTPVSSTKGATGHCFGAAGAIEAVFTTLAIVEGKLPPTINYEAADPECDLDYIPNEPRDASDLRVALSNSFGFGGHNASLVIRKFED
jgi:3-oxoacyl-[acyl-carrier-protein] synthase II